MNTIDREIVNATEARDAIIRRSEALSERAARLTAMKAERDQAQAEIDALMRADAASLCEWARSGANGKPPAPDIRAREAAVRKLASAQQSAQSVDSVLDELHRESLSLSREMEEAQQQVRTATANYLARLHAEHMAEQRQLEDRLDVSRAICAGIFQTTHRNHAQIAGEAARVAEVARVEWMNSRNDAVDLAIAQQWAKITSTLPGA